MIWAFINFLISLKANLDSKDQSTLDDSEPTAQTLPFNKLAGILIEPVTQSGKLVGVVMGIGLNVKAAPKLTAQTSEGMSYQAISLQDIYERLPPNAVTLPSLRVLYQQMSKALMAAMTRFEHLALEKPTGHTYYLDRFLEQFSSMDALAGLRLRVTQDHSNDSANRDWFCLRYRYTWVFAIAPR